MANGQHEDEDRQPRWNTVGYWTPRREGENWQGDPSRSRDYNREDMRRYGRRSVERGERLRSMRGQDPRHQDWDSQLDTDQVGVHMEHSLDLDRYEGRSWEYNRDYPLQNPRGQRDQRHPHRQNPGYPGERREPQRQSRSQMRGSQQSGERPARRYDPRQDQGRRERPGGGWDRQRDQRRFRQDQDRVYPSDRRPGDNLVDNYWGRREMNRDFHIRDRGAWWNNVGGRPDFTSARGYRNDLPTRPDFDWIEDVDYDMDPGYEYEFGTDFDILDQFDRETARYRRQGRPASGRDIWDEEPNYYPDPREIEGGFEYGWEGPQDRQRARYREVWNLPRPQRPRRRG